MSILGKLKKRKKDTFLVEAQRKEMALKPEQSITTVESKIVLKNENFLVKAEATEKQIKLYSIALD